MFAVNPYQVSVDGLRRTSRMAVVVSLVWLISATSVALSEEGRRARPGPVGGPPGSGEAYSAWQTDAGAPMEAMRIGEMTEKVAPTRWLARSDDEMIIVEGRERGVRWALAISPSAMRAATQQAEDGDGRTLTLGDVIGVVDSTGSGFYGGSPPTDFHVEFDWGFYDQAPFNLNVADFDFTQHPPMSAANLGLGNDASFTEIFDAYDLVYPDSFKLAWITEGYITTLNASEPAVDDVLPRTLEPYLPVGDKVEFSTEISGTPNMGDGVIGWSFSGNDPVQVGGVYYVDGGLPPGGDGSSWGAAFGYLQDAITAASAGDMILVTYASGAYDPDDGGTSSPGTAFDIDGQRVYGGFTSWDNFAGRDLTIKPNLNAHTDNYHVVRMSSGVLDGFVITGGNAVGSGNDASGGGLFIITVWNPYVRAEVANCEFDSNTASGNGGAIFAYARVDSYDLGYSIVDCSFSNNTAASGGAFYDVGRLITPPDAGITDILENCSFTGNTATTAGGALYLDGAFPSQEVSNCVFTNNEATNGGGVSNTGSGLTHFSDCDFDACSAAEYGGAIHNTGALTVIRCSFTDNSAMLSGGGLFNGLTASARETVFSGNSAGLFGGAVSSHTGDFTTLTNAVLFANSAQWGGGAAVLSGMFNASNCTISRNHASDPAEMPGGVGGGGIAVFDGTVGMSNSILWDNSSQGTGGVVQAQIDDQTRSAAAIYSCVEDDDADDGLVYSGLGNIDSDPKFIDGEGGNLRVQRGSPVIDAGSNSSMPLGTDLDGEPRKMNDPAAPDCPQPGASCGTAPIVDMGAYEARTPIYVWENAPGRTPDGETWDTAFTDLESAIGVVDALNEWGAPEVHIKEIWVGKGTYRPTWEPDGGGARSKTFRLLDGVAMYGGFSGNETSVDQRILPEFPSADPAEASVLDGNWSETPSTSDDSYHVVTAIDVDEGAILNGFAITRGNANGSWPRNRGGGITIEWAGPTIRNCYFVENRGQYAGAMYMTVSGSEVSDCIFEDNYVVANGGAVLFELGANWPTLRNCTFRGNTAGSVGGAISNASGSLVPMPQIIDCLFEENTASNEVDEGWGGAIFNWYSGSIISGCTFRRNHAFNHGGAMKSRFCPDGYPYVTNCKFYGNSCDNDPGGGIVNDTSSPTFVNCALVGNSGPWVGGMWNLFVEEGKFVTMVNSTLTQNVTTDGGGDEGGIANSYDSDLKLYNCILWDNDGHDLIDQVANWEGSTSDIQYSLVDANGVPPDGAGNIAAPPQFVESPSPGFDGQWGTPDDNYGDVRLLENSPAIDAGASVLLPEDWADLDGDGDTTEPVPLDLDLGPRSLAFTSPAVQTDMGAYEFGVDCDGDLIADSYAIGSGLVTDCNGNDIPDFCDLRDCYLKPPAEQADCDDCNGTGTLDECDIAAGTATLPDGTVITVVDTDPAPDGDGVPDSCHEAQSGGRVALSWNDTATWSQGVVPDNGVETFFVTIPAVEVELDIAATVDYVRVTEAGTLYVTGAVDEDLTLATSAGLLVEGDRPTNTTSELYVDNDRTVDASVGQVTIAGGGVYEADPLAAGAVSASLLADDMSILAGTCECPQIIGGRVSLKDTMSLTTAGDLRLVGSDALVCSGGCGPMRGGIAIPPELDMDCGGARATTPTLVVNGDFIITGLVSATFCAGAARVGEPAVTLRGSFINQSTFPEHFDWGNATILLDGTELQVFEIGGENLGLGPEGFVDNFAIDTLEVATDAVVMFVDDFDNSGSGEVEAFYVNELIFRAGAVVIIEDVDLFYNTLVDEGAAITILGGDLFGSTTDCNGNDIPDELEPDCNGTGVPDDCDVIDATSTDCNGNLVPDECEIDPDGGAPGGPYYCEVDCDPDCNTNGVPDACDPDADGDTVPDDCDICPGGDDLVDTDADGVPDDCDPCPNDNPDDVDGDGVCTSDDNCDLPNPDQTDCQPNGVGDVCDLDDGTSLDTNGNDIPDECEAVAPAAEPGGGACAIPDDCLGAYAEADCIGGTCYIPKNRYLSIDPTNLGPVAYQVEITAAADYPTAIGRSWWVDTPVCYDYPNGAPVPGATTCEGADRFGWVSNLLASPVTRTWTEAPLHITGCGIAPAVVYEIRASADDGGSFSDPLEINTAPHPAGENQSWGDLTGGPVDGSPGMWLAPEGVTNLADVQAGIRTFENRTEDTGFPPRIWVDVEINQVINMGDVQFLLGAFEGTAYADLNLPLIGVDPSDCP